MNAITRLLFGPMLALILYAFIPHLAEAKYIGSDPPCPACKNNAPINGNMSLSVPITTVSSTSGSGLGLDLALSYNT